MGNHTLDEEGSAVQSSVSINGNGEGSKDREAQKSKDASTLLLMTESNKRP
jgi:hypothetical protein